MEDYFTSLLSSRAMSISLQNAQATKCFEECFTFAVISRTEGSYSFEDGNFSGPNHFFGRAPFVLIDCRLHGHLPTVRVFLQAEPILSLPVVAEFR